MYTRCTFCDTWLRISAEQLRLGMGQVRCGSCAKVFNGLAHLADLSPTAPQLEPVAVSDLPPERGVEAQEGPLAREVTEAEVTEAEVTEAEVTEAEVTEAEVTEVEATEAEATEAEVTEAEVTEAEVTEADASESDATEPRVLEPRVLEARADPVEAPAVDALAGPIYADEPDQQEVRRRALDEDIDVSGISVSALDKDDIPLALRADYARRDAAEAPRSSAEWTVILFSALALLALPLQYAWFQPDDLSQRYPLARPYVQQFCAYAGCELRTAEDRGLIQLVSRDVRIHPRYEGALQVQATFINRGPSSQSFPSVRFTLFNVNGDVIGGRLFTPREYLRQTNIDGLRMESGQTTQIQLDLIAPEDAPVSFEFEFI